jgi:hypothetical protein
MSEPRKSAGASAQLPSGGAVFLDHVGHFVADAEAATQALARAGFTPTPISVQVNPDPAGGPPKLTGTGNVCAMLRGGYLEMLFKTADTPLGAEHDAARRRYDGLHLVALAVADAEANHARLAAAGFPMQPLVKMQRPVETAEGPDIAAFEVVRIAPGTMAEGRVQMLRHLTERTVWQPRWLDHPNGAEMLAALTIVVSNPSEAAARFERFSGRPAAACEGGFRIALDRGVLDLLSASAWKARWPGVEIPSLPFMGETEIVVGSLEAARAALERGGLKAMPAEAGLAVRFPAELGHGVWCFTARG